MTEQYHNNYMTWGWGKFDRRMSADDKFWVDFSSCTRKAGHWREECVKAADLMYQSTDLEILVHFSGGIDSEIVCRAFLEAKRPFKVRICRFTKGYNEHDIAYAVKFCKYFNVEYSFFDFDMETFVKEEFYPFNQEEFPNPYWHKNYSKHLLMNGWGFQVFGEGDIFLVHDTFNTKGLFRAAPITFPGAPIRLETWDTTRRLDDDVYLLLYEPYFELLSYINENDIEGCNLFYFYTPELVYSFLTDEMVMDWVNYCKLVDLPDDRLYPCFGKMHTAEEYRQLYYNYGGNSVALLKANFKQKWWPEVEPRPKYTGTEKLSPLMAEYVRKFSDRYPYDSPGNVVLTIPYNTVLTKLRRRNYD